MVNIILYKVPTAGGAAKSIFSLIDYFERSQIRYRLVLQRDRLAILKILYMLLFEKAVIVNGLPNFRGYLFLGLCLGLGVSKLRIYLHEDQSHLDSLCREGTLRSFLLGVVLRRNTVCFASEWQSQVYLARFQLRKYEFWYETVPAPLVLPRTGKPIVGMVGYITTRKGFELFGQVAEQCRDRFDFYWVGSKAEILDSRRLSSAVQWLGERQDVHNFLAQVDILLFTARLDCFPLAIAEALCHHKRIVLYKENGWADKLAGVAGIAIFDDYSAGAVVPLLDHVQADEPDRVRYDSVYERYAGFPAFLARLQASGVVPRQT
jgi:glycosyltransferase involved in cell wall biosynthesis